MTAGYVNPLGKARVTPERIDMGVDYAGTGSLVALGNAIITQVNPGGWGQYGNYMAYQLTDGPRKGRYIYYAEGVTPTVRVGQKVAAGQVVANLIPGWHSGIEVGFGAAGQDSTYATASGGGYSDGARTASGQAFSDLVRALGGYPGLPEGRPVTGTAPAGGGDVAAGGGILGTGIGPNAGPDLNPVHALNGVFNSIVKQAKYAALALVAILGAFVLLTRGVTRTTHAEAGAPA